MNCLAKVPTWTEGMKANTTANEVVIANALQKQCEIRIL